MRGRVGLYAVIGLCITFVGCSELGITSRKGGSRRRGAAAVTSGTELDGGGFGGTIVAGMATFDDPVIDPATGNLTRVDAAPIASALVFLIDPMTQAVLAGGVTDDVGGFALSAPAEVGEVIVRIEARSASRTPSIAVYPQGTLDPWSIDSAPTLPGTAVDIHAAEAAGIPFNILAAGMQGLALVQAVEPGAALPELRMMWTPDVGGTYFDGAVHVDGTASYQDGWDDAVILHEVGHYVLSSLVGPSGNGGAHYVCGEGSQPQVLDRRLAVSEAWASAFSSFVRSDSRLVEHGVPTTFDLETPCTQALGPGAELPVASVLWDLVDGANGLADKDDDGIAIPFATLWTAVRILETVPHFEIAALADVLIKGEALTTLQWNAAFEKLCLQLPMPALAAPLALGQTVQGHVDASVDQSTLAKASGYHLVMVPAEGTLKVTLASHPEKGVLTTLVFGPHSEAIPFLASASQVTNTIEGVPPGPFLIQVNAQGDGMGQANACYALKVEFTPAPTTN